MSWVFVHMLNMFLMKGPYVRYLYDVYVLPYILNEGPCVGYLCIC